MSHCLFLKFLSLKLNYPSQCIFRRGICSALSISNGNKSVRGSISEVCLHTVKNSKEERKNPLGSPGNWFRGRKKSSDISWVLGIGKHREIGIHSLLFSEEMGLPSSDSWVSYPRTLL
ncbi:hypothetical protein CEXT_253011 [Caerostris extrusa]|uniref:Uncharacterized protein n=1 Tax=Caerostris extrusa TaxID=172846 RepID=A0AAV4S8E7_CAEEX|nr:hypothetical protein CEXT_253011 [Caerostris extrusa]